jgi:hypothetical protein
MKKQLKYLYQKTPLKYPMYPLKYLYDIYRFRLIPEKLFIKRTYKKLLGVYPDLEHPRTFSEKIQWLKLNDRTPLHTICADKYKVREYIKEKIGEEYLIPLVFETRKVNNICAENMPDYPVIIKTNHGSGGIFVVKDKNHTDFNKIQQQLKVTLKSNYYYLGKEWEYKNIKPRLIVERLMTDNSGNDLLNDYKIHCFNGKPIYIQTLFDRKTEIKETWYDVDWNQQSFRYYSDKSKDVEKPICLKEMLKVASELSKYFVYVRVDLYVVNGNIYFGELTFHPAAGFMKWDPQEWDLKLGSKLKLPIDL